MQIQYTLDQIDAVAATLLQNFNNQKIIIFNGQMGVGKTTLIKALAKQLGVSQVTSSPTFSLINEYLGENNQKIYHFDFYRINKQTEALDMGVEEYFYSNNFCFIEWPEKIPNLIPEQHGIINIVLKENNLRELNLLIV